MTALLLNYHSAVQTQTQTETEPEVFRKHDQIQQQLRILRNLSGMEVKFNVL